ncbi:uncharacterized protein VTP21DRAFT_8607 [Calcarisporiella thermophila]|uniref:uncharacterized protein n=1 Tax=Calcarisporiella thermophila TaxID=911321 RepID=UPI0037422C5B
METFHPVNFDLLKQPSSSPAKPLINEGGLYSNRKMLPHSPNSPQVPLPQPNQSSYLTPPASTESLTLDTVRQWSKERVGTWLHECHLGHHERVFTGNDVNGEVLLEIDNMFLKEMEIPTVGERVRILTAVRALRRECMMNQHLPQRNLRQEADFIRHRWEKFSPLLSSTSPARLLSRSDSKKNRYDLSDQLSPIESTKRNSVEADIMSLEHVKQRCVRVIGDDGQTSVVDVSNVSDAKSILDKVLHKFGINDRSDRYAIFVTSGGTDKKGEASARMINDKELVEICKSVDRPERDRLILRKHHQFITHNEFKRMGSVNRSVNHQYQKIQKIQKIFGELPPTYPEFVRSPGRVKTFVGERPPSELISSNLAEFFPGHRTDLLAEVGTRVSMRASHASRLVMDGRDSEIDRGSAANEENASHSNNRRRSFASVSVSRTPNRSSSKRYSMIPMDNIKTQVEALRHQRSPLAEVQEEGSDEETLAEEKEEEEEEEGATTAAIVFGLEDSSKSDEAVFEDAEEVGVEASVEEVVKQESKKLKWMKGALIGRGSFGDVYLGLNAISGELMAVKQVEIPQVNSATKERKKAMLDALQLEISLLKDLHHENIVQYLGSNCDDTHFYIFLEYVPGGSVAGLLADYGAFEEPLVRTFVKQILHGLRYLHERDIIHRDIKGANILVDNKGCVKISDFGISKKIEDDILTASGAARPSFKGSVFWMAPEVVKQTQYTNKADIWSLGCLVIEMLSGDHPWPSYTQMQAIFKIGRYAAPDIPEVASSDARDFLQRTFELNYQDRPSATELLKHAFLAQPGGSTP